MQEPRPAQAHQGDRSTQLPPSPEGRPPRKGRTRRRRWLLAILATLGGLILTVLSTQRYWLRPTIEAALSGSLGRRVRVAELRVQWMPLVIDMRQVRIDGASTEAPAFFESPRVLVRAGIRSLWTGGRALSRVDLDNPILRINAFPAGGDDIPGGSSGRGGSSLLSIRRLSIHSGAFVLNHRRVPLSISLADVESQLRRGRAGALEGKLAFTHGQLAQGSGAPLPLRAEIELALASGTLRVAKGTLSTPRSTLAVKGSLRLLATPLGDFELSGPIDLDELDRHLWRTGLGIRGDGRCDGHLTVVGPRIGLDSRLSGTNGVFDGVAVPEYSGRLRWDSRGFSLQGLAVRTLDGEANVDFAYPPAPAPMRLRASYRGVDVEGAVRAIFDMGPLGVASSATGTAELSWPRGRARALSGSVAFDMADKLDARTPLHGRFEWRAVAGRQDVQRATLQTPTTALRLQGAIDPHNRLDLAVEGDSSDLAAADDLGMRFRQALGNLEALTFSFSGRGAFRGRCRGTLSSPLFEGTFSGRDLGFKGVRWGRADWVGTAGPDEVHCHSLVLRGEGRELWLDGWLETGDFAARDRVEIALRSRAWPVEDFVTALKWDLPLRGPMTGSANVGGRRSAPQGQVLATVAHGSAYGVGFEELAVNLRLNGRSSELSSIRARVGSGEVTLRGAANDDETYDGTVTLRDIELSALLPAAAGRPAWGGKVSGDALLQGTLARPWLQGQLSATELSLGGVPLGPATLTLAGAGQPTLALAFAGRSQHLDARLDGRVASLPPFAADLRLALRDTALDPLARLFLPQLPAALGLTATGTVTLAGPLARAGEAAWDVDLADLAITLPDYLLRNRDALAFSIRNGQLRVRDVRLAGEGTNLILAGNADLTGSGPLALSLRGDTDLRALAAWTERVKGRGTARLQLAVAGTRREPQLEGRLDLAGAGLRLRGFPHGLEDVDGTVVFTERGARLEGLRATLGGGTVQADGDAAFSSKRLDSFEVRATGRGVGLRYPEGLRSLIDADLRVAGDAERQWVTGDIEVRDALWTRRYDVTSELLSLAPAPPARDEAEGRSLSYDVRLHVPGTLRVDNNLAALEARAELALVGSLDNPVVLGRADVERGRVYFRGNTYVLRRGTIDFANPRRIDPFFDIQAETSMRGYRVVLSAIGTLERVNPQLTSDPPLSPLQILNLLAGADDSAVTSLAQAQRDQTYLAATGAASLAAGRLSEEVGLERGAQRLLGLSRFSIDPRTVNPALAQGELGTAARLTVGKRITPDLSVLYAQDLGGKEEYLVSLEFTLSDRLSLLLTRNQRSGENAELGFDILLRHWK